MTEEQRRLVLELLRKRMSKREFLASFGGSSDGQIVAKELLESAYLNHDSAEVEYGLLVAFVFGISSEMGNILRRLADSPWHEKHEDVVWALDKLRDDENADVFFRAALFQPTYLNYDDNRALARKAIWALYKLSSHAGDLRLRQLGQSIDPAVRAIANEQLAKPRAQHSSQDIRA